MVYGHRQAPRSKIPMLKLKYMAGFSFEIGGGHTPPPRSHVILLRFSLVDFGFDVYAL